MDETAVRRGLNEARFRQANDEIAEHGQELTGSFASVPFICECDDMSCTAVVLATLEEYQAVRSNPAHFLIAVDQTTPSLLVEENERFKVVEKTGDEREVVERARKEELS